MAADRDDLPPGTLARLHSDLAGPRGYKRVDALLSAADPEAAVAALSPPELHELVTQVGLDDTAELIALATPAQIRGCLDLDAWDRDRPLVEPMRRWLAAVIDGGYEQLGQVWAGLDAEVRALFVQRHAYIYDLSAGEEPDDDDGRAHLYFTPDSFFCLRIDGGEDALRLITRLVDDLYRADGALARHTLLAARSEPPAELEEMAYRWRSGRLADLGYVDFHDALDLFQPLDPDKVTIGEGTEDRVGASLDAGDPPSSRLPATIAEEVVGRSFLAMALERAGADHGDRLQAAILILTNKVLAAARVAPGDLDAVRRGAHYAAATLSLGLEVVSRGDLDRAGAALRTVSMTRLHRVGYTVTLRLARLARALAPRATTAGEPVAPVLGALVGHRPWLSRALDTPPGTGVRPFGSHADVRRVAELLATLGLRIAIAEALGVDLLATAQAPEPRPALDDHARTAMVRAMLGRGGTAPLGDDDLVEFRRACFDGDVLAGDAEDRARAAITGVLEAHRITGGGEAVPGLVAGWLADLERTFAPLAGQPIDGRFVDGVVVTSQRS
jgi:hypothetical protein